MHPAELVARSSYGRLLSLIAMRTYDLASAEDALAEAFLDAVEQWPREGAPRNPEAWLLTAARRRLVDAARRRQTQRDNSGLLDVALPADEETFPDERLRLLFVCAHPAIEPAARTPLMLQTVLGLDAARIAATLRVAPKTMGQRLWRAKTKIREARIPFEKEPSDLAERAPAVYAAIYAAYGSGWEDLDPRDSAAARGLTEEAIWLARLTTQLLPDEPEARGLLALMLFAEARARARRSASGDYVPFAEQDPVCWDWERLAEAEATLHEAARMGRMGPYQLEAAIQSAHVDARRTGIRDDRAIALLYEGLVQLAPTLGTRVAHAVALANVEGPIAGLDRLDAIAPELRKDYQPYWSARAHLLERLGRRDEAVSAYELAIGLSEDPAIRRFLVAKMSSRSANRVVTEEPR